MASYWYAAAFWILSVVPFSYAAPSVEIPLAQSSNLFTPGQPIRLEAQLKEFPAGELKVTATVNDYFGKSIWTKSLSAASDGKLAKLPVEIGELPNGYYELQLRTAAADSGEALSGKASFGVAPFVERSAKDVRDRGYRFGLKKYNFGKGANNQEWNEEEAVAACCRLGLQWTRELLQQKDYLGTVEMIKRYPMNVVMKVERFPKELYDAQRYGPMEQWEAKFGKGAWTLKTLPMKEPYQKWLREELKQIPSEQNVFEIWNEAWDKMSPEDFGTICQWIAEVILAERPDAIIGPNFLGQTSPYEFDARVIKAGGMKGMKMVALHPYGNSEDRQWLRDYRRWVEDQVGHPVEIYVTEFGSHSTPEGPAKRSETQQAQRVVRQALALYVEDVKAFMPHWMGQSERNPTYHEEWFGFFRLNHQPKPVLMAYANAARLIDASRYVGDLWYGPESDAMLFERDGVFTLALGTKEKQKQIEIEPGVAELTFVDMVGTAHKQPIAGGKLKVDVGPDWVYLVGVSPNLAQQASKDLRSERWPAPATPPRVARTMHKLKTPIVADGQFTDWAGMTQLAMLNPKVNGDDASGMSYLAWDENNLYVGVDMRDNEMLNNKPRAKLYQHDGIELFVSTEPRDENVGYGPRDFQFFITPTSGEGQPVAAKLTDREAGVLADIPTNAFYAGKASKGWVVELAIPWTQLGGFVPQKGAKLALEIRVNDADTSHERFKIDPSDLVNPIRPENPTLWSFMTLDD